jgi:hypothetical protein
MPTNDHDLNQPHRKKYTRSSETPGYETTDVNVGGVAVFLAGLLGSVFLFFFICYVLGKVINGQLQEADGRADKWHQSEAATGKRQDLASNPELEQKELNRLTTSFPQPRLDTDDGNQATADLHAREDLLLDHYSRSPAEGQAIRIPIERAMQLIAERGLPVFTQPATSAPLMVGDARPEVQAPLTTGFARTGYELDTIEAREQKMEFNRAESAAHAELTPAK